MHQSTTALQVYETATAKPRAEKSQNLISELYFGTAEKTFEESSYWEQSQRKPYNPDDLFQRANDYSIYEDMLNDDQVDACMQIKRDLVVGSGWDIEADVADSTNEKIQEDLRIALGEDPDVAFDESLEELISSYGYGFSLSEKIFKHRPDGSLTLKAIKTRHPSTWLIHTDKHGNVERYHQRGVTRDIDVEPKSLIHLVNNKRFQNPYGRSDLRAAYNAWFVKRQIIKYYGIFLEKAASPTPVAKYDKNAPQSAVADIHNAIKKLQTKTALTIPKDIEIEFLESKSNGEAFIKGINIFNMFIGRSLLIPDLLGFQGSETAGGSYALGKDQISILFKHIERRRQSLERIINKEIVWPLVVYNHGFVQRYPKFKFRPINDEHLVELAKLWTEVVKGKTYTASEEEINHFRSIVKFPQGEVEYPEAEQVDEEGDEDADKPKDSAPDKKKQEKQGAEKPAEDSAKKEDKEGGKQFTAKIYKALPGDYDKKVDYTAIKSAMERSTSMVLDEALPVVKRLFEDLYDQIKAKKILQTQDAEKVEALKLKSAKDLNLILRRALRDGFKEGQIVGRRELLKGVFRPPLPDEKFLEFIENETYQYVGDWSYNVTKKARLKILEAIRDGKPLSAVIDMLDQEGVADSLTSIERFARTKYTDVMNRGRLASFNESGVVAAYQYSAILDDRTSEVCSGLHGKVFKSGDEPVPPMHFNALLAGSEIRTMNGNKNIEDVRIGDRVLTHLGNWMPVYDAMSKFEDKEYLEIELEDGKVLHATGEHPVLTKRGWIRAAELVESDDVICFEDIRGVRQAFNARLVDSQNGIAAIL